MVIALGAQAANWELECSAPVALVYPTVVWTQTDEMSLLERALAAGAAAYIAGDAPAERINTVLKVAQVRFAQQRALRSDLDRARQALADRKVIDRAKGILMERCNLAEDRAYHLMRRIAMNEGRRLIEIAQAILANPSKVQAS